MAAPVDDVDDLLDEIEGSLQKNPPSSKSSSNKTTSGKGSKDQSGRSKLGDVNELLKSLDELEDDEPKKKSTGARKIGNQTTTGPEIRSRKCRNILLSGPNELSYGHCSVTEEKACDNLHCMKCDFQVQLFKGQHWVSSVNYMFFRNFMPDRNTLSKKLSKSAEHTAYCCQCSWISASSKKQISQNDSYQWCCDSH